jgi:hypothetical protein
VNGKPVPDGLTVVWILVSKPGFGYFNRDKRVMSEAGYA